MRKAKSIFGSGPEAAAFRGISLHLPAGWKVYPNLPLSQLVRVGKHELPPEEWDLYLKTSVDFTLAADDGVPSLLIEFDGLGGGFSSAERYVQARTTNDPNRAAKLDFKLRVCKSVDLPLIVISFEEIVPCTSDGVLSIVNSIAAQHVARRTYRHTIDQWDKEGRGAGKSWDDMLRETSDLDAEIQFKFDPFLMRMTNAAQRVLTAGARLSMENLFAPDIVTAMREKLPFESVGCRFMLEGGKLTVPVVSVVWVRNWAGNELAGVLAPFVPVKGGVNPLRVAENIAQCLGYERACQLLPSDS